MSFAEFVGILEKKIAPFSLTEEGRSKIATLFNKYDSDFLLQCIDIGAKRYFQYDGSNHPTKESVGEFLDKLGGIAYNKSQTPIDQEILHIKNIAKKGFFYWNDREGNDLLSDYIYALRQAGWSDSRILDDLQTDVVRITNRAYNWSEWKSIIVGWINEIKQWEKNDSASISQEGTIIPDDLSSEMPRYMQRLSLQINASYEQNLFDCTAVMMRRLLEILLILSYKNHNIETEIMDPSGTHHIVLDKIIKNAEQNKPLALSSNTKRDMVVFKELGNFSAHKIWYNCTQQDINHHALKYRAMIEELLYKAGLK